MNNTRLASRRFSTRQPEGRATVLSPNSSGPDLVDGFTRKTFTAMIEGVRESAIEAGMTDAEAFDAGVRDLYRTAEVDGVFCYTFFKGVGEKRRGLKLNC